MDVQAAVEWIEDGVMIHNSDTGTRINNRHETAWPGPDRMEVGTRAQCRRWIFCNSTASVDGFG
jgi:hypothetical protein